VIQVARRHPRAQQQFDAEARLLEEVRRACMQPAVAAARTRPQAPAERGQRVMANLGAASGAGLTALNAPGTGARAPGKRRPNLDLAQRRHAVAHGSRAASLTLHNASRSRRRHAARANFRRTPCN
jgi:hypothetical protein